MDAYNALANYYESYDEDGRLGTKYGQVEFLTTMHYINRYLQHGMRILEIGAGTGRYSHFLAQQGYEVDAIELMPKNIEVFREKTQPGEKIRIFEGSATDLSFSRSEQYDMTLLLGPMYHLFTKEEKISALKEALRVTKPGGILMIAYCGTDAAIHQAGFMRGRVKQLIENGMLDPVTFKAHSEPKDLFELHRKEEIDALIAGFSYMKRLHYVGCDMLAHYMRGTFEEMDDETFDLYMRYHLTICERQDMVGVSNHILDVFRKGKGFKNVILMVPSEVEQGEERRYARMRLSEEGIRRAEALFRRPEFFGVDQTCASNYHRSFQTAHCLAEAVRIDERLAERRIGDAQTLPADFWARQYQDHDFKNQNGESLNEAGQRVDEFIRELLFDLPDREAAVVVSDEEAICGYLLRYCEISVTDAEKKLRKIIFDRKTVLDGAIGTPGAFILTFEGETVRNIKYIE